MAFFGLFTCKKQLGQSGLFQGATDRHSHILPGVDDGVKTLEESLEVLAYGESLGIKHWWCTPHIMEDCANTTAELKEKFATLCQAYNGPIRLHLAAEYMLDTVFEQRFKEGDLLTMEDDTILVEVSVVAEPYDMTGMLDSILSAGFRPLLAHPERYRYLTEKDFEKFHDMGVLFQLNLGSVTGYYGPAAEKKARWILEKGWYTAAGSDCHRLSTLKKQYSTSVLTKKVLKHLEPLFKNNEDHL